jgi:hypothetical protein
MHIPSPEFFAKSPNTQCRQDSLFNKWCCKT